MTTQEFSLEFDLLYDNISSKGAPGINEYEKSVYLTKAQLEIIKEYNGKLNKYGKSFDGSEKRRVDLKELIRDFKSTSSSTDPVNAIDPSSKFFSLPKDVFLIKFEQVKTIMLSCPDKVIDVESVTLDEFKEKRKNPFRKPTNNKAFRVDFNSANSEQDFNVVELICPANIRSYHIRYLKYPDPIILTNLKLGEYVGMNLTIDGEFLEKTCLLNKEIHREILDRAVELAILDYKTNNLQSKLQINNRNN